jgi:pimeloyl-ACP methyl ester carboxylesterase
VPVTEIEDEQAMLPDNEFVAPSIEVLLAEAQKAGTVTRADTPQKQWVALVINELSTRLQGGEAQVEVLGALVEFALLPAKGRDAQILVDFANEQMPEALATQLNALAEGMTVRDVRATMWHIEEVAAAMSFVGEQVTGMHELVLYAINCAESVVFHSQADVDAAMGAAEFPQLDEFEAYSWPLFATGCGFFPKTETIDASFLEPVRSEIPALIIQGAMDIQTPLSGARELAGYFPNSQLVEFNSEGHVVASKTGSCPGTITAQFLADPLSPVDASCAQEFVIQFALPE